MIQKIKLSLLSVAVVTTCISCMGGGGETTNVSNVSSGVNKAIMTSSNERDSVLLINTCQELQAMQKSPLLSYKLARNINCSGMNFVPITLPTLDDDINMANMLLDDAEFKVIGVDSIYASEKKINTCEDLRNISNDLNGIYRVANNIDCSDESKPFVSIGTEYEPFTGKIYGNNRIITGLKEDSTNFTGIFGYTSTAYISNLSLDSISINVENGDILGGLGVLVGVDNASKFANINGNQINITANNNCTGSLFGYLQNSNVIGVNITNSNVLGTSSGGIACSYSGAKPVRKANFSNGNVVATDDNGVAGGIIGVLYAYDADGIDETINLEYDDFMVENATITGKNSSGGISGELVVSSPVVLKISEAKVTNIIVNGSTYSTGYLFGITQGGKIINYSSGGRYSGTVLVNNALMKPSIDVPIGSNWDTIILPKVGIGPSNKEIRICDDLRNMQSNLNGEYILMNNIDCAKGSFTPIGNAANPFKGTLNGNGYAIYYLNIGGEASQDVGMFAYTKDATIKNIKLLNPTINVNRNIKGSIGSIVANASGGLFKDISVTNLNLSAQYVSHTVGGVIGSIQGGSIENIEVNGNKTIIRAGDSSGRVGGVLGRGDETTLNNVNFRDGVIDVQSIDSLWTGGIIGELTNSDLSTAIFKHAKMNAPESIHSDARFSSIVGGLNNSIAEDIMLDSSTLTNFTEGYLAGVLLESAMIIGDSGFSDMRTLSITTSPVFENLTNNYGYAQMKLESARFEAQMVLGNYALDDRRISSEKIKDGEQTRQIQMHINEDVWSVGQLFSIKPLLSQKGNADPRNVCMVVSGTEESYTYSKYVYTFNNCSKLF